MTIFYAILIAELHAVIIRNNNNETNIFLYGKNHQIFHVKCAKEYGNSREKHVEDLLQKSLVYKGVKIVLTKKDRKTHICNICHKFICTKHGSFTVRTEVKV